MIGSGADEAGVGWADAEPPARWLRRTVPVFVAVASGSVMVLIVLAWTARDADLGEANTSAETPEAVQSVAQVLWGAQVVTMVVLLVAFVVWTRRLAVNHVALTRPGTRFGTPTWALVSWLVWFVLPFFVVRELWKGSDSHVPEGSPRWRGVPTSPLVPVWFTSFVGGVLGTNLTNDALGTVATADPDHLSTLAAWRGAFTAVLVVSALVLWRLTRDLTQRQLAAVRAL